MRKEKKAEDIHAMEYSYDGYLPTGRAGDTTMGEDDKQKQQQRQTGQQGTKKNKNEKDKIKQIKNQR